MNSNHSSVERWLEESPGKVNEAELLFLIRHGRSVFGHEEAFYQWLQTRNFHFNNEAPSSYLDSLSGIQFVDERLTAMEYGDNV